MKCPACDHALVPIKTGPVILDTCQQGCRGIWFDARELEQVSRAIPAGQPQRGEIVRSPKVQGDERRARKCARCRGVKLERKLFSLGTGVIMDCCPKCAGIWLDHGELDKIREETNPKAQAVRHVVKRQASSLAINFAVVEQVQAQQVMIRNQSQPSAR